MKKTIINLAVAAVLGASTLMTPATAGAVELRYASVAPPGSPWAKLIATLVANAAKNSGENLVVKPFLSGQLGSEPVVIEEVARGRVDMGGFTLTATALVVPELGLLSAPYLWDSRKQAVCALDKHLNKAFQPYFAKRGLVNLGWGEAGYQEVFSKKPMPLAADYKGVNIRVAPAKGSVLAFKALGANGVVLPAAELNGALQTGLVSAAEMSAVFGVLTGVGQIAPVINLTNHIYLPTLTVVNKEAFDNLSPKNQKALLSAPVPAAIQRQTVRAFAAALTKRFMDAGGKVLELGKDQRAILRKKMIQSYPRLVAQIGGEAPAVWAEILKAKAACTN